MVEAILLAEFDINIGSTVRLQYPKALPGIEIGTIASYMLPEGAHNHSSD